MLSLSAIINGRAFRLGVLSLGVVGLSSLAAAQSREFRLSIVTPPSHTLNRELVALNGSLKRESGGRLSIAVFPTSLLGSEAAVMQQLQAGTLDMAWVSTTELANWVPEFAAIQAPFLVKNVEQAAKLFEAPVTVSLLDKLPTIGVVGLGFGMFGMRYIYTRDQANSLADLRGKKIRTLPSAPVKDFYAGLGMVPTPIPFFEIYNALASGQIDAIDMDLEGTLDYKFYDHLNGLLLANHCMVGNVVLVSGKVWASLPPSDQTIMRSVTQKHLENIRQTIVAEDKELLAQLRRSKLKIKEVDAAFFGSAVSDWDNVWLPKAPNLKQMRETAAKL
jgi:TRAP-type C4-dicarboxylate transport system substrate-binding protein